MACLFQIPFLNTLGNLKCPIKKLCRKRKSADVQLVLSLGAFPLCVEGQNVNELDTIAWFQVLRIEGIFRMDYFCTLAPKMVYLRRLPTP